MGLGDRRHHRQPEPEPAGLAAAVRRRAGEPAEYPVQVLGRDAAAGVRHGEHRVPLLHPRAQLDEVVLLRVRDRVLEQCVHRHRQPLVIGADGHFSDFPEPPAAGRVSPPVKRLHHHRVDPDRRHVKEARVAR